MPGTIRISSESLLLAQAQSVAAGFNSVDEYVTYLILHQRVVEDRGTRRIQAVARLRALRRELPKLSTDEIVAAVHEARMASGGGAS